MLTCRTIRRRHDGKAAILTDITPVYPTLWRSYPKLLNHRLQTQNPKLQNPELLNLETLELVGVDSQGPAVEGSSQRKADLDCVVSFELLFCANATHGSCFFACASHGSPANASGSPPPTMNHRIHSTCNTRKQRVFALGEAQP